MRASQDHAWAQPPEPHAEQPVSWRPELRPVTARPGVDEKLAGIIFNSISDGVFTVDKGCIITSFNSAAERITGFTAREASSVPCSVPSFTWLSVRN